MGNSMAGQLLARGYRLNVHTRTRRKAANLIAAGATWCGSPAELAARSDVSFSIVGTPQDVEQIYLGQEGLVAHARQGSVLVDMTTSTPSLADRIAKAARARGIESLDAPVSGGDRGAREARLSIMVGGERSTYEKILPLFRIMGKSIVYQGGAGAGQHTKVCNQIAVAANMLGVCEALAYAHGSGLDANQVLQSISSGAAASWSLSNLAPRILKGDFAPGFFVKHLVKDLDIALQECRHLGLKLPALRLSRKSYGELAGRGHAEEGTQALARLYFNT